MESIEKTIKKVWIESLERNLELLIYWKIEVEDNLKTGCTSILPSMFLVERLHDISLYVEKLGDDSKNLDWAKMYEEATKRAMTRKENEANKTASTTTEPMIEE